MSPRKNLLPRRDFIRLSAAVAAGLSLDPSLSFGLEKLPTPMKRTFGKTGFDVTTLGLGGQASIQWTGDGIDPVEIILKAFRMSINYFDTSNLYGNSQLHYGEAFRRLNLIPGKPGYDIKLRESIWITTKSHIRWAKAGFEEVEGIYNWTQGNHGEGVIGDLKRSLSQMFGDGQGNYPEGSYVNLMLIHDLNLIQEVDILYKGLETPLNPKENFGALVALRDYRDGTNLTGLNPKKEKLIRHLGFSGHRSAPAMMDMIRRDEYGLLDAMLVAINPNDRYYLNMQYNVIPVAEAKGMGIIAMKVFADGAMYGKKAEWSNHPGHVVMNVGTETLPSKPLVEYALTIPGVQVAIIGIGHIDEDPFKCQLVQNYYAAQIKPDALTEKDRRAIEKLTHTVKEGKTNYFQASDTGLSSPANVRVEGDSLLWDSAVAGDEPIEKYEIFAGAEKVGELKHIPQTTRKSFLFKGLKKGKEYTVVVIDRVGRIARSRSIMV